MIKHGSKMIQAVTTANVPQLTVMCGASFGAGNYGMCGRGFAPRFLFSWPNAETAVMGTVQAAPTMGLVFAEGAQRRGQRADPAQVAALQNGSIDETGLLEPSETPAAKLGLGVKTMGDHRFYPNPQLAVTLHGTQYPARRPDAATDPARVRE